MARRGDNIHKRKDGRWEGRYYSGNRPDGSKKYSSVYAHSYAECKKKLGIAQASYIKKIDKISDVKLFSEVVMQWFETNEIRLKGATKAKYIGMIESHILPCLGGIKASKIDSKTVNLFLEKQLVDGGLKDKKVFLIRMFGLWLLSLKPP